MFFFKKSLKRPLAKEAAVDNTTVMRLWDRILDARTMCSNSTWQLYAVLPMPCRFRSMTLGLVLWSAWWHRIAVRWMLLAVWVEPQRLLNTIYNDNECINANTYIYFNLNFNFKFKKVRFGVRSQVEPKSTPQAWRRGTQKDPLWLVLDWVTVGHFGASLSFYKVSSAVNE